MFVILNGVISNIGTFARCTMCSETTTIQFPSSETPTHVMHKKNKIIKHIIEAL